MLLMVSVPKHKFKWIFGFSGESDDDREDIFAAANSARKAAGIHPSICHVFLVLLPQNYSF